MHGFFARNILEGRFFHLRGTICPRWLWSDMSVVRFTVNDYGFVCWYFCC